MNFHNQQCSDSEVALIESQWKSQGFRLTNKSSDKELLPMEYRKSSYRGDINSFDGPRTWLLTRRNRD